jgi:hypothetical protein
VEYYEKSGGYKKLVTSSFVKVKTLPDESLGRVSFYKENENGSCFTNSIFGSGYFD